MKRWPKFLITEDGGVWLRGYAVLMDSKNKKEASDRKACAFRMNVKTWHMEIDRVLEFQVTLTGTLRVAFFEWHDLRQCFSYRAPDPLAFGNIYTLRPDK